jgi:hypothetical protein
MADERAHGRRVRPAVGGTPSGAAHHPVGARKLSIGPTGSVERVMEVPPPREDTMRFLLLLIGDEEAEGALPREVPLSPGLVVEVRPIQTFE